MFPPYERVKITRERMEQRVNQPRDNLAGSYLSLAAHRNVEAALVISRVFRNGFTNTIRNLSARPLTEFIVYKSVLLLLISAFLFKIKMRVKNVDKKKKATRIEDFIITPRVKLLSFFEFISLQFFKGFLCIRTARRTFCSGYLIFSLSHATCNAIIKYFIKSRKITEKLARRGEYVNFQAVYIFNPSQSYIEPDTMLYSSFPHSSQSIPKDCIVRSLQFS
ncbi:hypothetical protein PUN28_017661 [Cardiocondyla obscurior]|uniref:Uncharacterized protein n=1 Tax=Cardiocondyla obscurior TaxID=286306 RepID=A0AAW2EK16_9HYME